MSILFVFSISLNINYFLGHAFLLRTVSEEYLPGMHIEIKS